MKPGNRSKTLLVYTRSKGKMLEYDIPEEYHIKLPKDPHRLFPLSIGILGDFAETINNDSFNFLFSQDEIDNLLFSVHFLEAFHLAKINSELDEYIKTLVASAYYFASFPGSALVFSKELLIDFDNYPTLSFLNSILSDKFKLSDIRKCIRDNKPMGQTLVAFCQYINRGKNKDKLERLIQDVLEIAYQTANSFDLLICDLASAVVKLKLSNSVWSVLSESSGVSLEKWKPVFESGNFIKELWPSQKILAKEGVFSGGSATIQMPTSAGKTKSTEIILRSYFFKNNTQSAVLVAPFRALCHEINDSLQECFADANIRVNECTDVFQKDYSEKEEKGNQIIITTPEKLVYILRQDPALSRSIGLLILDEGHQFDSDIRGVTYELLITSLKQILPATTQWVLISAVLSNAEEINDWLNGENGKVVSDSTLSPTQKTIGFVNWTTPMGQIQYANNPNINEEDFFVPRVITSKKLNKKRRERKDRFFPEKSDGSSIALHLGLKLVKNGCIAIFCGKKTSVIRICDRFLDIHSHGYETPSLIEVSGREELARLGSLYTKHLGNKSSESFAWNRGVLTHHASLPHGLRLAVEYALREEKARFVICTSTLAQGVNLPIRYLIFTNIYQAGEKLKVRDFHNLVGRAGRAGVHTEGTILFSNPEVYEKRRSQTDKWRWNLIENILIPENSEPCSSSLLGVFDKIQNNAKKQNEKFAIEIPVIDYLKEMVADFSCKKRLIKELSSRYADKGFDERILSRQFDYKEKIINSIEGYLLSNLPDGNEEERSDFIEKLTKDTLAFRLANEEQKKWLVELFEVIANSLIDKVPESEKRALYGKTLVGVKEIEIIDKWLDENIKDIFNNCGNLKELLICLWKLIFKLLPENSSIKKLSETRYARDIAIDWILGCSYHEIHAKRLTKDSTMKLGERNLTVQHTVDICEGVLAFDGMLILGAIIELVQARGGIEDPLISDSLKHLQKTIKYGLQFEEEIQLFERGFSDREVAMTLGKIFIGKKMGINNNTLLEFSDEIEEALKEFPSYFTFQFKTIKNSIQKLRSKTPLS